MAPTPGPSAVLLLEVRGTPGRTDAPPEVLGPARALLEGRGEAWSPASGPGLSGSLALADAAEAFRVLHGLRTELRAEPSLPSLWIAAGIGRGDDLVGPRLAGEAFRSLGKRGKHLTRARTGDEEFDVVLDALCRTLDTTMRGWTAAQWQAIHRRDRGRTLFEVGDDLGIAYQNVSKRLIAARYSLYQEVLGAASLLFSRRSSQE